jgi:hypothetical protein
MFRISFLPFGGVPVPLIDRWERKYI